MLALRSDLSHRFLWLQKTGSVSNVCQKLACFSSSSPLAVAGIVVYFVDAPKIDFRVNCGPVQALGIAMPFFGTTNFIPIGVKCSSCPCYAITDRRSKDHETYSRQ